MVSTVLFCYLILGNNFVAGVVLRMEHDCAYGFLRHQFRLRSLTSCLAGTYGDAPINAGMPGGFGGGLMP